METSPDHSSLRIIGISDNLYIISGGGKQVPVLRKVLESSPSGRLLLLNYHNWFPLGRWLWNEVVLNKLSWPWEYSQDCRLNIMWKVPIRSVELYAVNT